MLNGMNLAIELLFVMVFLLYPVMRIFSRAGIRRFRALVLFIPGVGIILCGLVLALSTWNKCPSTGDKHS